jgi:hypothetical protein
MARYCTVKSRRCTTSARTGVGWLLPRCRHGLPEPDRAGCPRVLKYQAPPAKAKATKP